MMFNIGEILNQYRISSMTFKIIWKVYFVYNTFYGYIALNIGYYINNLKVETCALKLDYAAKRNVLV